MSHPTFVFIFCSRTFRTRPGRDDPVQKVRRKVHHRYDVIPSTPYPIADTRDTTRKLGRPRWPTYPGSQQILWHPGKRLKKIVLPTTSDSDLKMKWFHRTSNTGCGGADAAADEPKLIKISPLKHARAARCGQQRIFPSSQAFSTHFPF